MAILFINLTLKYIVQVLLYYASTISAILVVSIWLEFVSMSYVNLFMYFISASVLFFIIWYVPYVKLKREVELINVAIINSKKNNNLQ